MGRSADNLECARCDGTWMQCDKYVTYKQLDDEHFIPLVDEGK